MAGDDWPVTLVGSKKEDAGRQAVEVSNKRDVKRKRKTRGCKGVCVVRAGRQRMTGRARRTCVGHRS